MPSERQRETDAHGVNGCAWCALRPRSQPRRRRAQGPHEERALAAEVDDDPVTGSIAALDTPAARVADRLGIRLEDDIAPRVGVCRRRRRADVEPVAEDRAAANKDDDLFVSEATGTDLEQSDITSRSDDAGAVPSSARRTLRLGAWRRKYQRFGARGCS